MRKLLDERQRRRADTEAAGASKGAVQAASAVGGGGGLASLVDKVKRKLPVASAPAKRAHER